MRANLIQFPFWTQVQRICVNVTNIVNHVVVISVLMCVSFILSIHIVIYIVGNLFIISSALRYKRRIMLLFRIIYDVMFGALNQSIYSFDSWGLGVEYVCDDKHQTEDCTPESEIILQTTITLNAHSHCYHCCGFRLSFDLEMFWNACTFRLCLK